MTKIFESQDCKFETKYDVLQMMLLVLTHCISQWWSILFVVVCKFKAHKRCAVKAQSNCKWTTLAAIGREILEDEDGVSNHGLGEYMHFYSMGLQ